MRWNLPRAHSRHSQRCTLCVAKVTLVIAILTGIEDSHSSTIATGSRSAQCEDLGSIWIEHEAIEVPCLEIGRGIGSDSAPNITAAFG